MVKGNDYLGSKGLCEIAPISVANLFATLTGCSPSQTLRIVTSLAVCGNLALLTRKRKFRKLQFSLWTCTLVMSALSSQNKLCFVIGPMGDEGSDIRAHFDLLLQKIIEPVLAMYDNFQIERPDRMPHPGLIDAQIINRLFEADIVIADLSNRNPNVFYEIGIRHVLQRSIIHMHKSGEMIPFDISLYRSIPFSFQGPSTIKKARDSLHDAIESVLSPDFESINPVTHARRRPFYVSSRTAVEEKLLFDALLHVEHRLKEIKLSERFSEERRKRLRLLADTVEDFSPDGFQRFEGLRDDEYKFVMEIIMKRIEPDLRLTKRNRRFEAISAVRTERGRVETGTSCRVAGSMARKPRPTRNPGEARAAYKRALQVVEEARQSGAKELHLDRIDLKSIEQIPPLHGLTTLESVVVGEKVRDLGPLLSVPNIKELRLNFTRTKRLSSLGNLAGLERLSLFHLSTCDFSGLSLLHNLQSLAIIGGSFVNPESLAQLLSLNRLNVTSTGITDISALSKLRELYELDLSHTNVTDLTPIYELTKLRRLILANTKIVSLAPIARMASLEELHLSGTDVSDLSPLASMGSLRELDFRQTKVDSVSALVDIKSLRRLNVSELVSDILPLSHLPILESLNLEGSAVADLSPLAKLDKLKELNIAHTRVSDLAPLAYLSSLVVAAKAKATYLGALYFLGCPLKDKVLRKLATRVDPERTVETISYLRKQQGLPSI